MIKLSKSSKELLNAYHKGYRIVNGIIYNPCCDILKGSISQQGYNETRSYKQTMDKFGITSKGTLNYIIKKIV